MRITASLGDRCKAQAGVRSRYDPAHRMLAFDPTRIAIDLGHGVLDAAAD
ncbi:MAG TPA: hypothetical protein VLM85_31860 [Polyangiaceae bacterium]|nr:hypothetical protein [Polyangiaceae bacterium]